MVELTMIPHTLTLHKVFLGFHLAYMSITDYQFMQSLNVTNLTPEQHQQLMPKLPNYTMINYDLLREYTQHINEN